jgi:hypothetical protein
VVAEARRDHPRPLSLTEAHAALVASGITMTPGKVRKVLKAHERQGHGQDFAVFVGARLEADSRVITYAGKTGETAVSNVMGGTR